LDFAVFVFDVCKGQFAHDAAGTDDATDDGDPLGALHHAIEVSQNGRDDVGALRTSWVAFDAGGTEAGELFGALELQFVEFHCLLDSVQEWTHDMK
jgi:hypothetical protein